MAERLVGWGGSVNASAARASATCPRETPKILCVDFVRNEVGHLGGGACYGYLHGVLCC